jgi:quercetin dioxygenase-like cupin family protein
MNPAKLSFSYSYNNTSNAIYKASIGEGLPKHEHTFAHTTVCIQGKIIVRKNNKEIIIGERESPLLLTENEWHEIESLEDNTIFINQFPLGMEE